MPANVQPDHLMPLNACDYRPVGEHYDYPMIASEVDNGGVFFPPDSDHGAPTRRTDELRMACDGWRFNEHGGLEWTDRQLPYWPIDRYRRPLDPTTTVPFSEQGVAVVVSGSIDEPADICYFDPLGRVVGHCSTKHHNPYALDTNQDNMHRGELRPDELRPVECIHTGWELDDAGRVVREWKVIQWADGSREMPEELRPQRRTAGPLGPIGRRWRASSPSGTFPLSHVGRIPAGAVV